LKFSNGGHLLAAAYPKQKYNIHHINIYNAYTLEEVAHLTDHNNIITEMVWTRNDEFLLSTGLDGAIIEWRVSDWSCKKFIQTNSRYTTIMYNYQNNTILAAGT
jgi:WD40 repeat protein